jgi:phosphatidylethanolamine/phosphatidyl-N-methylethanolamine N-methyltransferase
MTLDEVQKIYDRYSDVYDFLFKKTLNQGRVLAPELLEFYPGAHLLEVGVGTGLSLDHLPRNIRITGIDISRKMLAKAEERVRRLGIKDVQLVKMDATSLAFPDDTFDRVLAAYTVTAAPDPLAVVQEMRRVCRPGGIIVMLNHFEHEDPFLRFVEKAISPLCSRIGFKTDVNLSDLLAAAELEVDLIEKIDASGNWKAVRVIKPISEPVLAPEEELVS